VASFEVEGRVTLDTSDAVAALQDLQQKLADLAGQDADPNVTVETEQAQEDLDDVQTKLAGLDGQEAEPTVTANTEEATAKLDEVRADAMEIDGTDAEITVTADTSEAESKMGATQVEAESTDVSSGGDGGAAAGGGEATGAGFSNTAKGAESADSAAENLGTTLRSLAVTGPMVATAMGGAFAALPGILSGVTGAIGGLVAGFMGISSAIQAYIAVQNTASQTALQMESIQISSAQSMQNASAQVVSAETSLSQAQVQSYDSVYNAQEQLVMSEQQLEAAQYGQRASQLALTEATMQAKFQLQDYQQQIAQMAIQLQQANENVQETKLAMAETLGDPAATELQREQAKTAYAQALQQVTSLKVQQGQLQQEYKLASSLGVQGSQQVQAAQQGVTQSTFQLQDAQKGVQTSQMMLGQAHVAASQQMMLATQQVTLALSAQKATAAEVGIALATPIGAYGQLDAAMAALGPAGQQFVNWFMTSFYPVLKQLEFGAEGALLPGIERALTTMGPYFRALGNSFNMFDSAFGVMLGKWATFLSSKQGLAEFNAAMNSGLGFMNDIGNAILDVMKGFGSLALVGGPATKAIGNAIVLLAQIFNRWASSPAMKILVQGFDDLVSVFTTLFKALGGAGGLGVIIMLVGKFSVFADILGLFVTFLPQLMPLFEAIFNVFKRLMTQAIGPLMPLMDTLVSKLGGALANALIKLTPSLIMLAQAFLKVATSGLQTLITNIVAFTPEFVKLGVAVAGAAVKLIPAFDSLIKIVLALIRDGLNNLIKTIITFMPELVKLAPLILAVVVAVKAMSIAMGIMNAVMDANPIGLIIIAVIALAAIIMYLADHWRAVWTAIKDVAVAVWHFLYSDVFKPLEDFFGSRITAALTAFKTLNVDIWHAVESAVKAAWDFIWGDVLSPLVHFFEGAISTDIRAFATLWNDVWNGIKSVVQTVWSIISPIFNSLLKGIQTVTGAIKGVVHTVSSIGKGVGGAVSSVAGFVGKLFADGGYVNKPTPAIVGEAGPEVILPLTNPARSLQLLRPLMEPGGALAMASSGGGGGTQQIINLQAITTADPTAIAREIAWELKTMTVAP